MVCMELMVPNIGNGLRRLHDLRGNRPHEAARYGLGIANQEEVVMSRAVTSIVLRRALMLDAVASGLTGAIMLAGAGMLEGLLDLPAPLLRGAGLVLVPYVAFVAAVATRPHIAAAAVWSVIACNALWTAASFALLASGAVIPNVLGVAFVAGQAIAVAALGGLQYIALRQPAAAHA
jgi:hypothetical protein